MIKYSFELKSKAVNDYLSGMYSYSEISMKYKVSSDNLVRTWVSLARAQGIDSLKIKHSRREYHLEEKLEVIDYYQTHDFGPNKVAAHFGINPAVVYAWNQTYREQGIAGLKSKPRGRRPKMKTNKNETIDNNYPSNIEKETLIQENMKLKAELHKAQMDRDILKKLMAVSKNNLHGKKQK